MDDVMPSTSANLIFTEKIQSFPSMAEQRLSDFVLGLGWEVFVPLLEHSAVLLYIADSTYSFYSVDSKPTC